MPRVMPIGGEKEGKLALPIPTIFLHVWIEIERGVIEAACPLCADGHLVALSIGKHRAWQCYGIIIVFMATGGKSPLSLEVNTLGCKG